MCLKPIELNTADWLHITLYAMAIAPSVFAAFFGWYVVRYGWREFKKFMPISHWFFILLQIAGCLFMLLLLVLICKRWAAQGWQV